MEYNKVTWLNRIIIMLISFSIFISSVTPTLASAPWANQGNIPFNINYVKAVSLDNGKIFIAGGETTANPISQTALYTDGSPGTWTQKASMNKTRRDHILMSVTINTSTNEKRILAAGGMSTVVTNTAELWNESTNTWTNTTTNMTSARVNHAGSMLNNGKVFVTGGMNSSYVTVNSTEIYDPLADTWTATQPMNTARRFHQQVTFLDNNGNERVMVIGGFDVSGTRLYSTEIYDPVNDSWSNGGNLAYATAEHKAIVLNDGRILVVGAQSPNNNKSLIYDPATASWGSPITTAFNATSPQAVLLDSNAGYRVLVAGGESSFSYNAQIFDPSNDSWVAATYNMNTKRARFGLSLLSNGNVIASGGINSGGKLNSSERFIY